MMTRLWRGFSACFFVVALGAIVVLLGYDICHRLEFDAVHQRIGAVPFLAIGLAYMSFQLTAERARRIKGLLLGLAFVLWGTEQFLPETAGIWLTIVDNLVVIIFVVDLGSSIVQGRKLEKASRSPEAGSRMSDVKPLVSDL